MHCWQKHNLNLQSLINQNISKDFFIVKFRFANLASFIRVQVRGQQKRVRQKHRVFSEFKFESAALSCRRAEQTIVL